MSAVAAPSEVGTGLVRLQFADTGIGIPSQELGKEFLAFENLTRLLGGAWWDSISISAYSTPPGPNRVDVVYLRLESPLEMVLSFAKLPASVARGFVKVCQWLIFHEEEKSRRAAEAASVWEDVRAKRLRNLEEAIRISYTAPIDEQIPPELLRTVVNVVEGLETSTLALKHVSGDVGTRP